MGSIYNKQGARSENAALQTNRNGDVLSSSSTLPSSLGTITPLTPTASIGLLGTPWADGYFSGQVRANSLVANTLSADTVNATSFVGAMVPAGDLIPVVSATYDLGSTANKWKDIYFSGRAYGGGVTLTAQAQTQDIIPVANALYTLGNNATRFTDLYLSGNVVGASGLFSTMVSAPSVATGTTGTVSANIIAPSDGVDKTLGTSGNKWTTLYVSGDVSGATGSFTGLLSAPTISAGTTGTITADVIGPAAGSNQTLGTAINQWANIYSVAGTYSGTLTAALLKQNLPSITSGTQNVVMGNLAGAALTTGSFNVAIGERALSVGATTSNNTAIGTNALRNAVSASDSNTAIGMNAMYCAAGATPSLCVAIGPQAMSLNVTTAANTVAVGAYAGNLITSASGCTLVGTNAGQALTTGSYNSYFGFDITSANNVTGGSNTVLGANNAFTAVASDSCVLGASNSIGHTQCIVLGSSITTAAANRLYLGSATRALGTATTVGAAGGATALPATPTTYLIAYVNGTQYKIPLYDP